MSSSGGLSDQQINKEHKARRAGNKFKKREAQRKKKLGISEEQQKNDYVNNRANTVGKGNAYARDLKPPKLVAVVGPPKSGKTTLITSLVKQYTKQTLTEVTGPITVRTGKSRTTFFECPNDINAMIDISKTADLVLLLIDASYGFEMENFEFLNMLQVHGMTRVMGILTHLDLIKKSSTVRKLKKKLKHRFWTEVCDGAKLFYLSGLRGGLYTPRETINLSRFISIIKPRPIKWRTTHSCVVVDRFEDVTDPELIKENPTTNRHVCMYGYVRNTFLRKGTPVHIPGCGDFTIKTISSLDDPLPPKPKEKERSKLDKYKGLYGPMSNLGSVFYDKDSVYVDMSNTFTDTTSSGNHRGGIDEAEELLLTRKGKDISSEKREERKQIAEETSKIVQSLLQTTSNEDLNLDEKLSNQQVKLFSNAKSALVAKKPSKATNIEHDEEEENENIYIDESDDGEDDDDDKDEMEDDDNENQVRKRRGLSMLMNDENDDEIYANALNKASSTKKENVIYDDDDEESHEESLPRRGQSSATDDDSDSEYFEPKKLKMNQATGQFEVEVDEDSLSDLEDETNDMGQASNKWKETMEERAASAFYDVGVSLQELVYENNEEQDEEQDDHEMDEPTQQDSDDLDSIFNFKKQITDKKKKISVNRLKIDYVDRSRTQLEPTEIKHDWDDAEFRETIRNKFVTGDWAQRRSAKENSTNQDNMNLDEDSGEDHELNDEDHHLMEDDDHVEESIKKIL
ncbi:hypothetical protein C9374_004254 [Naegleria lovaniensis]|uniref:Bms1-type G domain-containing protein n=1 Tax=Naegleria lovaniensis TaxID=51637 RepID=A0AA88KKX9_NAELO|nr:uncharacterized protein C9374_004254 [Naegleria lovaniensis]KAG2383583.1 hypothetical protein C9374_004254 [Naegleria lovaniensis]